MVTSMLCEGVDQIVAWVWTVDQMVAYNEPVMICAHELLAHVATR